MMIRTNTLSTRIALAMLSVLSIGIIVLGIVFFYTFDHMEHKLLEMLDSSAEQSLSDQRLMKEHENNSPNYIQEHDVSRLSSSDYVPEEFKKLTPGFYHDIEYDDKRYHVAVKKHEDTKRYLIFDITDIEAQEHILTRVIFFGVAAVFLSAIWITYWLAKKVISPVRKLADQVKNMDPNERNVRLSGEFHDVEIGSIAQSFDQYMERLDGFVEREQSFTSTASHELRTPLSVISTSVELIESKSNLPSDTQTYIDKIKKSVNDMSNLISALLFLAREDLPKNYTPSQSTDITQLTRNIIESYQYVVKDKNVKILFSADNTVEVDIPRSHAQIVISNLLNNAIRFTQEGVIDIKLNNKRLEVTDTGTGIDEAIIKHIFERGIRGEQSSGYGFGLYICKRICERYNWNISLTSNPNGTTALVDF